MIKRALRHSLLKKLFYLWSNFVEKFFFYIGSLFMKLPVHLFLKNSCLNKSTEFICFGLVLNSWVFWYKNFQNVFSAVGINFFPVVALMFFEHFWVFIKSGTIHGFCAKLDFCSLLFIIQNINYINDILMMTELTVLHKTQSSLHFMTTHFNIYRVFDFRTGRVCLAKDARWLKWFILSWCFRSEVK